MEGVGSGEGARRKRSKWDDVDEEEGRREEHDDEVLERQAVAEARAKAAAKAARQRAKAAQRSRQREVQQEGNSATSTPTASSTDAAGPSSLPSAPLQQQRPGSPPNRRRQHPPVPPRSWHPPLQGCRSIHHYERLNHIEEGSYGVVFRAREKETGEIVALKKLKMDKEKNGFPITSLREIRTLMEASHENVVRVREIVVGDTLTQIFIVMDFIEHDLKTLLTVQTMPFLASEIKTLLHQLLSAMSLLHRNWIIHRDLKTSNLLMNNRGQLKLADFGLARMYGEPIGETMTQLVVTLWYRAPELLLGATTYDTAIDMWSVGCIFAELMTKEPLFTGKNEIDQITRIFRLLGQPTTDTWPAFNSLSNAKKFTSPSSSSSIVAQPFSTLRQRFKYCTENCLDLLSKLLTYDPAKRITADEALQHPYFRESPAPAHPDSFGSFPSVAAGERKRNSPSAPERLADQKLAYQLEMDL